jgi:hypothetical protein
MTNAELKSKAMTLGNKLAPRMDGDRRAAFVEAWAIVKAGGLEIPVRGVSFGNRQEALRRLASYRPQDVRAVLVPEPSNPVDPAAVAVMVGVQGGPRTIPPGLCASGHGCGCGGPGTEASPACGSGRDNQGSADHPGGIGNPGAGSAPSPRPHGSGHHIRRQCQWKMTKNRPA